MSWWTHRRESATRRSWYASSTLFPGTFLALLLGLLLLLPLARWIRTLLP